MGSQAFYEDVKEGGEIPSLKKEVSSVNILMYVASVWLMDRIHFDHPFATKRRGLPGVVAPGNMGGDYYAQLLSEYAGERGQVRKMSFQFRNFMLADDVLTIGGKVVKKFMSDGKGLVELELWIKNQHGVNCVPGKGLVALPMRAQG
jgi:hydroxyacyl-ACP dehydratase HTD2-like protein with hotdog domain